MARSSRRTLIVLAVFLTICGYLGLLFAQRTPTAATANGDTDVRDSLNQFAEVYKVVEENYAEPVNPDKAIYNGAIPGMLHVLDPHSNFFDPKSYSALREEQRGKYYGVGMQVGPRNNKVIVIAPFVGTPAYRAGIRPGDIIIAVDGKPTDNMNTSDVAELLKGPKGTNVKITILREEVDKPMDFNIIRDEIPRASVDLHFMIRPGIGYMHVAGFQETTEKEVSDALDEMGDLKGLILDLRENPGGLLQEGVATAGHWLDRGQVVVSHKGRAYSEKPYVARGSQYGESYPIVVLVNRYSASAAEIVAGALQDHDRAWILGDVTFGKGLVQTVYPLNDNTGLALTTQHYYTPSGRLIQRNYTNISFLDYYYGKRGETKDPNDIKQTDLGRTVYGGGGITPDEKFEPAKLDAFELSVARKNAFFGFSAKYFSDHDTKLQKGWVPDESVVESFHDYLLKQGLKFTEEDWAKDHAWVRNQLRAEMYVTAFSYEDSQRVGVEQDLEVQKAIDAMPKAASLLAQSKTRFEKQRASIR